MNHFQNLKFQFFFFFFFPMNLMVSWSYNKEWKSWKTHLMEPFIGVEVGPSSRPNVRGCLVRSGVLKKEGKKTQSPDWHDSEIKDLCVRWICVVSHSWWRANQKGNREEHLTWEPNVNLVANRFTHLLTFLDNHFH